MVADWHVTPGDRVRLLTELSVLASRQRDIEDEIREASYRQRFSQDPAEVERAHEDERRQLTCLDRVLTGIRSLEGKLTVMPQDA